MIDLLRDNLEAENLPALESLKPDKREIDIKETTFGGKVTKTEILEGSMGCKNYIITLEIKEDVLEAFNIKTSALDNCQVTRN